MNDKFNDILILTDKKLEKLKSREDILKEADTISAKLLEIEDRLHKAHVRDMIELKINKDESLFLGENPGQREYRIMYANKDNCKPFSQTKLEVRLKYFHLIPELLDQLANIDYCWSQSE